VTQLQVSNYELGVIVPVYDVKEADGIVCWERPPKCYETQGDQPWVGADASASYPILLTFLCRFRVSQPCSTNWTGYRGLYIREPHVGARTSTLAITIVVGYDRKGAAREGVLHAPISHYGSSHIPLLYDHLFAKLSVA